MQHWLENVAIKTKVQYLLKNVAIWSKNATLFYKCCIYEYVVRTVDLLSLKSNIYIRLSYFKDYYSLISSSSQRAYQ